MNGFIIMYVDCQQIWWEHQFMSAFGWWEKKKAEIFEQLQVVFPLSFWNRKYWDEKKKAFMNIKNLWKIVRRWRGNNSPIDWFHPMERIRADAILGQQKKGIGKNRIRRRKNKIFEESKEDCETSGIIMMEFIILFSSASLPSCGLRILLS